MIMYLLLYQMLMSAVLFDRCSTSTSAHHFISHPSTCLHVPVDEAYKSNNNIKMLFACMFTRVDSESWPERRQTGGISRQAGTGMDAATSSIHHTPSSPQMVDDWRHVVDEISSMTRLIQPLVLVKDETEATGSQAIGNRDSGRAVHLCLCTLNQQGSVCQGDPDPHTVPQLWLIL